MNAKRLFDIIAVVTTFVIKPFRHTFIAKGCGHKTQKVVNVSVSGIVSSVNTILREDTAPSYCPACLREKSIRCSACGGVIRIRDEISFMLEENLFPLPPFAVNFRKYGNHVIVCSSHVSGGAILMTLTPDLIPSTEQSIDEVVRLYM